MVIAFDIETLKLTEEVGGWDNFIDLGISCIVFYDSDSGKHDYFSENGVLGMKEISECSHVFKRVINENILLLGHNINSFDIPLIGKEIDWPNLREETNHLTIDTLEALEAEIGFKISLDNVAEYTLGQTKSMDAREAPTKWRKGHYQDVLDYCKNDVDLSYLIFEHGRKEGHVKLCGKYDDEPRKVSVSW